MGNGEWEHPKCVNLYFVVRASCSLDIHSEQDAFPYRNTALTHYQIVFFKIGMLP
ncbi:MAG: hypothetical protein AAF630_01770 [Cyanobacteria bacterium P01_C01_bin.38]